MEWHHTTRFEDASDLLGIAVVPAAPRPKTIGCAVAIRLTLKSRPFLSCHVGYQQIDIVGSTTQCKVVAPRKAGQSMPADTQVTLGDQSSKTSQSQVGNEPGTLGGLQASGTSGRTASTERSIVRHYADKLFEVVERPSSRTPAWTVSAQPPGMIMHKNLDIPVHFEVLQEPPTPSCNLRVTARYLGVVKSGTATPAPLVIKLIALAKMRLNGELKKPVSTIVEFEHA